MVALPNTEMRANNNLYDEVSLAPHRSHIHPSGPEITASISQRTGEDICCSIAITPPIILHLIAAATCHRRRDAEMGCGRATHPAISLEATFRQLNDNQKCLTLALSGRSVHDENWPIAEWQAESERRRVAEVHL